MKTDELIMALAADTLPQKTVLQRLARAMPIAMAVSVTAFALFWGARSDIRAALGSAAALKTVLPLALALLSGAFAVALAHPGARYEFRGAALGLLVALVIVAFLTTLAGAGPGGLIAALSTPLLMTCLLSIPLLALPVLAAAFWGLSSGAALHPRLTGAAGGLMAGGLAASVYSIYCDNDRMLFVLPAYSAAIMSISLLGAILGPRLLKW
ncbi:MAG: NrsF family protein [Paracoccaceae bacterium]